MYKKPVYYHSLTDILQHIKVGETTESFILDFKRELNNKIENEEIACDICQFSNKWGGAILFGVDEAKNDAGYRVASRLSGVNNAEEIKKRINNSVRNLLYPQSIYFDIAIIERKENLPIVSLNVPPFPDGICCVREKANGNNYKFPIRTEYGKVYMSMDTVEKSYSANIRRISIKIHELCSRKRDVELVSPIVVDRGISSRQLINTKKTNIPISSPHSYSDFQKSDGNIYMNEPGDSEFKLWINSRYLMIPYGLVSEVWETEFNKIGMFLKVIVIITNEPNGKIGLKSSNWRY